MKKFFPFLSPTTTIASLFLGLFGITAFGYMLTGIELDMFDVHQLLSTLPNPIEFVNEAGKVFNAVVNKISLPDVDLSYVGNDVLKLLFSIAKTIVNGFAAVIGFIALVLYALIIGPFYCVFFLIKIFFTIAGLLGFNTSNYSWVLGNWSFFNLIGVSL